MKSTDEKWALLQACRRDIEERLTEKIDLEALAARYGYAYSSFRKFFRENTGYSIHRYIRLRRLFRAARILREGGELAEAIEVGGFETISGFSKAFLEEFGVSFAQYAASRGRILMREPELMEKEDFFVVGYVFEPEDDHVGKEEELGAYWLGQEFPELSAKEFQRVGGGEASVGFWPGKPGRSFYILGSPVKKPGYVPAPMESVWVPGGRFARFTVPQAVRNQELSEAVRATWFFALRQWLPESPWEADGSRIGYEYYLNGEAYLLIPIRHRVEGASREIGGSRK